MTRNKITKKILCTALAVTSAFASLATLTACETSNPEVKMTVTFNGKDYELNYKLFRKLAPTTTTHFLELVDAGYYNGLCVHDYSSTEWETGAYTYDATKTDNGGLVYKDYFAIAPTLNLTQTVWKDEERKTPTYTVYGEFSKNKFEVENGKVVNGFGALTMRYTDKGDHADTQAWVKLSDESGYTWKDYGYNSATSMFSINVSTTSTTLSDYCTFAELDEDSVEVLEDLKAAIADYIGDQSEDENFTVETEAVINAEDVYAHEDEVFFNTPVKPIKIETITVEKW